MNPVSIKKLARDNQGRFIKSSQWTSNAVPVFEMQAKRTMIWSYMLVFLTSVFMVGLIIGWVMYR